MMSSKNAIDAIYTAESLEASAKQLFAEERAIKRLDGWFLVREISENVNREHKAQSEVLRAALAQSIVVRELPLTLSDNSVFAGTQRDAFAKSYALINPNFKVSTFNGYCDPTAVFNDIEANDEFPQERIERVRRMAMEGTYVKKLREVYARAEADTGEVAYFVEQVTGHLIPDFRKALKTGVKAMIQEADAGIARAADPGKAEQYRAMKLALESVLVLAGRYRALAQEKVEAGIEKERFAHLVRTLEKVPAEGAENLFEAIQSFLLLWQVMCLEQAPNPFAFSVGNADRIFEPYRAAEGLSRELAAGLFKHFLVFFNVGDRSWAISQNILVGGRDAEGKDLTNLSSFALFDAYFAMNLPQPILSVKLHRNSPDEMYREMGKFFFTPGCLTPSLFNDDAMFRVLAGAGVDGEDLADYSVAGCQEPLIMGKDNGNTTNSWLNLGKILELTLLSGKSAVTGKQLFDMGAHCATNEDALTLLKNVRARFDANLDVFARRMERAANGATEALSHMPVPFLSAFMGGMESGIDLRDVSRQGTKYNGSGCLIHGLSVVSDSFVAIDHLVDERPEDALRLLEALENDFAEDEELRLYLASCPKFGNNIREADEEAARLAEALSEKVSALKNKLGNPFRPDFASPSTHLTYGYWVGATPDGRRARTQLNYGVDPLYGCAENGLGFRTLSALKLPYGAFRGGYAAHFGLDPKYFIARSLEERGMEFKNKIIGPLFFAKTEGVQPFYLYLNITTPETLRKVLANPKKYAPSGVYIMRIHGTFVNFLDLSPEIQTDIIARLDLDSTAC